MFEYFILFKKKTIKPDKKKIEKMLDARFKV